MLGRLYSVYVGGVEVNDYFISASEAIDLFKNYKEQGYDDVKIQKL